MAEEQKKETGGDDKIQTVRTFESDAAEYIKQTGQSRASIALAEAERKGKTGKEFAIEDKKIDPENVKFILSIAGILLLAGSIIFLVFVLFKGENDPTPSLFQGQPIMIINGEKIIDLGQLQGEKALEKISETLQDSSVSVNSVLALKPVRISEEETTKVETEEFFKIVANFAPNKLVRSLDREFSFGIIGFNGHQPFLIFKTDSFENASSGAFEWERLMPLELQSIFEKDSGWAPVTPAYGPGSTSQSLFENTVISNLDARILKNESGKTVLVYSFPDKNTLVITTDEQSFTAIVTKLRNAKLVR